MTVSIPLVAAVLALGGVLGPAEAAASRVLHTRHPTGRELVDGYRGRPSGRTLCCAVATATVYAVIAATWGWSAPLVPLLFLGSVLVVMAAVDLEHYLIPNRLVFPAFAVAAVSILVASVAGGRTGALGPAAVGAVVFWLGLFVTHLVNPAGMGFGDVKLALLLGLYLGWQAGTYLGGPYLVLLALLVGSLLGSVVGVVLLIRRGRGAHYPFGPWLGLGTLSVLVGNELL